MNRRRLLASLSGLAIAAALSPPETAAAVLCPSPPRTRRRPDRTVQLGRVRIDDYAWLKDPNWKAVWRDPSVLAPDIKADLQAENAYADQILKPTVALQGRLVEEIEARTPVALSDAPQQDGVYDYYAQTGGQYPLYLRRRRGGGPQEVLFDAEDAALRGAKAGRSYLFPAPSPMGRR